MKRKKILLVEDNPDYAEFIIDELDIEVIKAEVILMKDGQEAIDYFQRADIDNNGGIKSQINLIILDINLPKVCGIDILRFLKKNPNFYTIPVVVFSSTSDSETVSDAYKYGAVDFITKPASYKEFVENVRLLREYVLNTNSLFPNM